MLDKMYGFYSNKATIAGYHAKQVAALRMRRRYVRHTYVDRVKEGEVMADGQRY